MISLDCVHFMWTMRTWIYFRNGKELNARSMRRFSTQAFYISKERTGTKPTLRHFWCMLWAKFLNFQPFLHFQLRELNTIPLTDFTQYFYCALLLCLDKSTWLAQSKHPHGGDVHSGLNAYTVKKKPDIGKKLAQFLITVLFTSHYVPDASHMRPISSGVSVSSLALKLLG